jgi:hypothetical protein
MSEEVLKIKTTYKFDSFLMYLIQDITKRSSAEILNFFYELTTQVREVGLANRTGNGIHKKIADFFPGTSIPFHVEVRGQCRIDQYDLVTRKYSGVPYFKCQADIGFPTEITVSVNEKALEDNAVALMEKALLDAEDVPVAAFVRPQPKTPKMYKKLMDSFVGREPEPRKRRSRLP